MKPTNRISTRIGRLFAALGLIVAWASVPAQQAPAFLFEPMLDTYFDDQSGLIAFHGAAFDLAFPRVRPRDRR